MQLLSYSYAPTSESTAIRGQLKQITFEFQTSTVSSSLRSRKHYYACRLPAGPVSLPPSVCRDVDGVDPDLRDKISDRLPSIEDQEQAAVALAAAVVATARDSSADGRGEDTAVKGAARVTLPPATLARALPHIRRVMGNNGQAGSVRSALGLLRGGGLVFPEGRAAAAAAMKHTEVG